MWKCENCGRTFEKTNQSHYCKEKPKTIDEYLDTFDEDRKNIMAQYRDLIKETLPQAKEKNSWNMPTFYDGKNIIHFAGHKNHLGIYPGPKGVEEFLEEIKDIGLSSTKGAIQIPYDREIPMDFIIRLTEFSYKNR